VTDPGPLISVTALADALASADPPTLLDVRWRLAGPPGRDDYLAGHIPGAVFVELDRELCGPPGAGGRHPLPEPRALQDALRAKGVRAGRPVVAYDDGDGLPAARLWWTLRWAGHPAVQVLDGGYAAWAAAGRPVEPGEVTPASGDITVRPGHAAVLDAAGAGALAREGVLLDARAPERFRGETEPVDAVAGHIPGAVNVPAADLTKDGLLRPPAQLRSRFAQAGIDGGTPTGAYCGSGVTAAHTALAMVAAGLPEPAVYIGSWSHWITDPDRPVSA
jgi:thiosulfate/3-mercaptopyruvate sulfurtransferase